MDARLSICICNHMAAKDFFRQGHGPGTGFDWRQENFLLQTSNIEWKQPAVLDYLAGNLIFTGREFAKRNIFPAANLVDQREVGRCQQPQVLAILLVDALDVFCDYQLDAGGHLSVRRLFAAGAFAAALSTYRTNEASSLHVSATNWKLATTLQPQIWDFSQDLVEIETVVGGSDFIGRDVVAQLGIPRRILRIPGQIFASKLALDELRVFGEKKNAPFEPHPLGPLFDFPFQ